MELENLIVKILLWIYELVGKVSVRDKYKISQKKAGRLGTTDRSGA